MSNKFEPFQVLIVNSVGMLADLYSYAKIAYVGAGFSTGVHSVIEPAVYKCIVSYGPNIEILDEAIEMNQNGAGIIINNGPEMAKVFEKIKISKEIKKLGDLSFAFVSNKEHASERIINEIFK